MGTVLPVPTYSQMVHSGHYPQWGGGGEAWCSATSTAMVLAYYGIAPAPTGITPGHVDAVVDHTAKMVYDHGYDGTGNWAFNTAYAATLVAGDSYVTRMRDLREAEDYIAAGVPLVVSIAFGRNQLAGAPISSSNGHLLVVVGFEADGDVVVNDPAGATNGEVRRDLRPRAVRADLDRGLRRDGVRHPQRLTRRSARADLDRVQPGRAVGVRSTDDAGLGLAVLAGRADPDLVVALGDVEGDRPLHPRVDRRDVAELGAAATPRRRPGPRPTAMPVCWCHATPPTENGPAATSSPERGTSMREAILTGPSADQPLSVQ